MTQRNGTALDALRLRVFFPLAKAVWRASETLEATGNWLEDLAIVLEPRPLRWHLRRAWRGEAR